MFEVMGADAAGVDVRGDASGVLGACLHVLLDDLGDARMKQLYEGRLSEVALGPGLVARRLDGSIGRVASGEARGLVRWQFVRQPDTVGPILSAADFEALLAVAWEHLHMWRSQHFPRGATLADGRFRIVDALRGGPDRGQYLGVDREGHRGVLVTLSPPHSVGDAAVAERLAYAVDGIAPLLHVGPLEATSESRYVGMVEVLPAGQSAVELLVGARGASCVPLWLEVARVVAAAHERGMALGGLRPELVYATDACTLAGLVPRCEPFFMTAEARCYGVPPCFDTWYLAPELILSPSDAPTPAADVFSLVAMFAHGWTGAHPYEGAGPAQLLAVAGGQRRAFAGSALLADMFERALSPDPALRYDVDELITLVERAASS